MNDRDFTNHITEIMYLAGTSAGISDERQKELVDKMLPSLHYLELLHTTKLREPLEIWKGLSEAANQIKGLTRTERDVLFFNLGVSCVPHPDKL